MSFRYHLYMQENNHGNDGAESVKVAKFRDRSEADTAGEALLEMEHGGIKYYERFFVVDKEAP